MILTYTTHELEADEFEAGLSIQAATKARQNWPELRDDVMVVINYREPSHRKRLYIYDIQQKKILESCHVAHGSGSSCGYNVDKACSFSNTPLSRCSSLGAMKTGSVYTGKHGLSMRLYGLESGVNSNVYLRSIVIHSAPYVTDSFIIQNGYAGHSWGCLAVNPAIISKLIGYLSPNVFIYCYQ